jgi:phage recombination protein Bet
MQNEVIAAGQVTPDQIQTLAKAGVIPFDTPHAVLEVFAHACKQHNLSPFKKEIYLVKYNSNQGAQYHTIVGIDGFRVKAARTGQNAGVDDPRYNVQSNGQFDTAATVKASGKLPISCTMTVYRLIGGQRCPFTATVIFDEYYPAVASGKGAFSKAAVMPFNMIAKCAEAKALKMAFSDELAGLHIEEEAAAFEETTIAAAEIKPAVAIDQAVLQAKITACKTIETLSLLYNSNPAYKEFADLFTDRKLELKPELMLQQTATK